MGNCLGNARLNYRLGSQSATSRSSAEEPSSHSQRGKNIPLRHERIRWKSDQPLTMGQVRSKRDEFWDTAPAFDGRKEIWDALKAAATATEQNDYVLSQAIIDGANITLPNGTLTDCYDELGTRYQLPVYCLSMPINIIHQTSETNGECITDISTIDSGEVVSLKVRLSTTLEDIDISISSTDLIAIAKQKLQIQHNLGSVKQRWYYMGKMLGDRLLIKDCSIRPDWIIQSIITDVEVPSEDEP